MPKEKSDWDLEKAKILFGLEETYKNLVKFKREKNSPIIVEQDGKIVELDPFSVPDSLASENDKDK
jgi:hypothetical protein